MRSFLLAAIAGLFLITGGSAQAAPSVTGTFDLPDMPSQRPPALGPDGNVWVTFGGGNPDYVSVSPSGVVTPYDDPGITGAEGIVRGPDGNMWVTGNGYIDKFSTANPTAGTKTPITDIITGNGLVVGPDGNLWTGSNDKVLKIPPGNPAGAQTFPTNIAGFVARGITSNGGKLWLANGDNGTGGGILPVDTSGASGPILATNSPVQDVASGPVGQVGYTATANNAERIGVINNGVLANPFAVGNIDPFGIIYARDQAYWVPQFGADNLARYSPTGGYSIIATFAAAAGPRFLAEGTGGTIWVVLEQAKKIVRISGVEPPASSVLPVISKISLTHKTFKIGSKKTALIAKKKKKKTPTGTTLKYTVSEPITASIAVDKIVPGRRSGTNCVKPTAKLKKAKKCSRWTRVGLFTRGAVAGANRFAFTGRFGKTKLKPGKYRFVVFGKNAKGLGAVEQIAKFKIAAK